MSAVETVQRILNDHHIPYALIGALAVAARGHPRSTYDIDFLTTPDAGVLREEVWETARQAGLAVDVRRGDFDDPLAGVIRITSVDEPQIDIVVGKYKWQRALIERSEESEYRGIRCRIPSIADLILLKTDAGGPVDIQDVHKLLAIGPRDHLVAEVSSRITDLPLDAQQTWQKILSEV